MVVIPLVFLIVLCGCLSLVLGSCAGLIAEIYNHAAVVMIRAFIEGIERFSRVPFGHFDIDKPSVGVVILWYVLLAAAAAVAWERRIAVLRDKH